MVAQVDTKDEEVVRFTAKKPSRQSLFYIEWGEETLKQTIPAINNALHLLVTLDTFLLTGYLTFYETIAGKQAAVSWQVIIAPVFMLLSLIAALVGILPFSRPVLLISPNDIKHYKERLAQIKETCLLIAAIFLVAAFIVFLWARLST